MKITELITETQQAAFVQQNYDTAKKVGDQLGVDPKTILGHWALETGWGKSVIPGTNNLGNIKDFSGKGTGVKAYDAYEKSNDAYRAYKSTDDFANDYASLLARKYPGVIGAGSDPNAFVQGLQGGKYKYATAGHFEPVMTNMPATVAKYLNPDNKWSMDPSKMMAKIQAAPAEVKNYIAKNFNSVKDFIQSYTPNAMPEPSAEEIVAIIGGKKLKFRSKKEAIQAMAKAKAQGIAVELQNA